MHCNRAGAEWKRRSAGSTFSTLTPAFLETNLSLYWPHLISPQFSHTNTGRHEKIKSTSKCTDVLCYETLRSQIILKISKFISSQESVAKIFFLDIDEIPQISTHWKHNAAFNLRHKTGPPLLSGGQPHTPFFFSILTHLFSMSQPPLLLLCETNSSFIINWGPQLPPLFQGTERRGDTTQLRNGSSLD